MKSWSSPLGNFPYTFDEVVSIFWDRYPNSFAKHIVSEDVLERRIDGDQIITKKLIVKEGSSILKRMPRWLSRMTEIRVVPVVEESIYNRVTRSLTTYTRNVTHQDLMEMHERVEYAPAELDPRSCEVARAVSISAGKGKMAGVYESVLLAGFRRSVAKTYKGFMERLEERFGMRQLHAIQHHVAQEKVEKVSQKIKEKLLTAKVVHDLKCEQ